MLRHRHRLQVGDEDDFDVQNMAQLLATFQAVSLGLTLFLGTIAAISLVVGGIGIMNIMLATVAERTREIGIRKALGAKDRDILRQVLIETLVITLGGGMVGLCLGHDILFIKHSKADVTPLIVKDRLTGHNPVAALYASRYFANRFPKSKD